MTSTRLDIECDLLDLGDGRLQGRVAMAGELDAATTSVLAERIAALRASGANGLIVDATDVSFLDSSGLRTLVAARGEIEDAGGTFLIDGMSPAVERVLDICGMLELAGRSDPPGDRS